MADAAVIVGREALREVSTPATEREPAQFTERDFYAALSMPDIRVALIESETIAKTEIAKLSEDSQSVANGSSHQKSESSSPVTKLKAIEQIIHGSLETAGGVLLLSYSLVNPPGAYFRGDDAENALDPMVDIKMEGEEPSLSEDTFKVIRRVIAGSGIPQIMSGLNRIGRGLTRLFSSKTESGPE